MYGFFDGIVGLGSLGAEVKASDCPHHMPVGTSTEPSAEAFKMLSTPLGQAALKAVEVGYDLRPISGMSKTGVQRHAAALYLQFFASRWGSKPATVQAVLDDPCFYSTVNLDFPLQRLDTLKSAGGTVKVDLSKLPSDKLWQTIDAAMEGASQQFKIHAYQQALDKKAKGESNPADVDKDTARVLGLPRSVLWAISGTGVVLGGVLLYLLLRKPKRQAAPVAFDGASVVPVGV